MELLEALREWLDAVKEQDFPVGAAFCGLWRPPSFLTTMCIRCRRRMSAFGGYQEPPSGLVGIGNGVSGLPSQGGRRRPPGPGPGRVRSIHSR